MKKMYIMIILVLTLFNFASFKSVYADDLPTKDTGSETVSCSSLGNFKGDLEYIFKAFKIVAPVLTLVLSSYEFLMAITSKAAEGLQKAGKKFGTRLVLVIVLYLLPTILNLVLNLAFPGASTCIS